MVVVVAVWPEKVADTSCNCPWMWNSNQAVIEFELVEMNLVNSMILYDLHLKLTTKNVKIFLEGKRIMNIYPVKERTQLSELSFLNRIQLAE